MLNIWKKFRMVPGKKKARIKRANFLSDCFFVGTGMDEAPRKIRMARVMISISVEKNMTSRKST